ncbi:gas vesicle protein [Streptomyces sp. NPDC047000]|uniref:gas vesicle protein n=1 Tax=Streptomyces sp. NPDC047000 TaxID=3155474 RepID=UPI003407C17C
MTMPSRLPEPHGQGGGTNLADVLERVLDKGVVIAGDIRINLLDIELLTIKLRLVVASVDKAKEMGIDWWEDDPALSSRARRNELAKENAELRERLTHLEELGTGRAQETADRPRKKAERSREPR